MTQPHPDEEKYTQSEENVQVARDWIRACAAQDYDKMVELQKKLILPLRQLKTYGKEGVQRLGLPTTTAEIANDTGWLK